MGNIEHIATSVNYKCVKEPKCDFCYLDQKDKEKNVWNFEYANKIKDICEDNPVESIAIDYSGYDIRAIKKLSTYLSDDIEFTITTMPELINNTFLVFLSETVQQLSGISLSFNEEVNKGWEAKAELIQEHGYSVACNYLLGSGMRPPTVKYDQLNILSRKPPDLPDKEGLRLLIMMMKGYISEGTEVVVDNYISHYLDGKKCEAGDKFVHVTPNGEIEHCSMQEICPLGNL